MAIGLTPYLRFAGVAREAMEYYHSVLGGEYSAMTFREGAGEENPQFADNIMHASLFVERGVHFMASDVPPTMNATPNGVIALSNDGNGDGAADADTLRGWWDKFADDSTIDMPLETAPWGDSFGQLTDRYGVTWMFNIGAQ